MIHDLFAGRLHLDVGLRHHIDTPHNDPTIKLAGHSRKLTLQLSYLHRNNTQDSTEKEEQPRNDGKDESGRKECGDAHGDKEDSGDKE